MSIKVIVFDLWNTLVYDDAKFIHKEIADILGFPDTKSFWKYCDKYFFPKSQKFTDFLVELCKSRNLKTEAYNKLPNLWKRTRDFVKIYPDSIPALEKLKNKYKLVILSNTGKEEGEFALTKFKLKKYFDWIILSCNVGLSKPNPRFFKIVCNYFDIEPSEICIVGDDYENDMIPAKEVGFKTILLDRNKEFSNTESVDAVVNSLNEVVNVLKGL